jgi:hypothetical protein
VEGLIVSGRCISGDYLATNTLRLIVPCFATGQAAGAAAALAVKHGVEPRDVDTDELRALLREQGVPLDSTRGASEADLADVTPVMDEMHGDE